MFKTSILFISNHGCINLISYTKFYEKCMHIFVKIKPILGSKLYHMPLTKIPISKLNSNVENWGLRVKFIFKYFHHLTKRMNKKCYNPDLVYVSTDERLIYTGLTLSINRQVKQLDSNKADMFKNYLV